VIGNIGDLLHQLTLRGVSFYLDEHNQLALFCDQGEVPQEILEAIPTYHSTLLAIAQTKWELAWRKAVETNESYRFFADLCESMKNKPEGADMWLESGRSDEVCPKCRWDITFVCVDEASDSMVRRCAACGFSLGFLAWRSRQRLLEAIRQVGEGIRPAYDHDSKETGQPGGGTPDAPNQHPLYQKERG
jgi:hypothetical protein